MRGARFLLVGLQLFAALNALGGGLYALQGARDVPREWLEGTPFDDYTIPGILLLVGAGLMVVAATMTLLHARFALAVSMAAGALLLTWILVQVALIGYVSWMQPVSFAAGLVMIGLASLLARKSRAPWTPPSGLAGRAA
jgi:small-conductance mechanosensitive channel